VLRAVDGALLAHPALGKATGCVGYGAHRPEPARFIWHHLQPEALGGATDTVNCVALCDTCHLCVHELLYMLRLSGGDEAVWHRPDGSGSYGTLAQRDLARRGYALCLAAGVQEKIPNEGGLWALAA
jgi:hypothetical protein